MKRLAVVAALVVCAGCDSHEKPSGPPPAPMATQAALSAKLVVAAAPDNGDVASIVRDLLGRSGQGRRLVVYVGATWCEPCQQFHRAAESGSLDADFPSLTLLEFDADRDRERLAQAGYAWKKYIPYFALPGPDGRASGKEFEGGIKGDGAVSYLSPRLAALLAE